MLIMLPSIVLCSFDRWYIYHALNRELPLLSHLGLQSPPQLLIGLPVWPTPPQPAVLSLLLRLRI